MNTDTLKGGTQTPPVIVLLKGWVIIQEIVKKKQQIRPEIVPTDTSNLAHVRDHTDSGSTENIHSDYANGESNTAENPWQHQFTTNNFDVLTADLIPLPTPETREHTENPERDVWTPEFKTN